MRLRQTCLAILAVALVLPGILLAQSPNVAEYYDDGETLWLVNAWYDPSAPAEPGPEDNFLYSVSSGGGGIGDDIVRRPGQMSTPVREFPAVISTTRRAKPGMMRVFMSVDLFMIGWRIIFGRRQDEEPANTSNTVFVNSECSSDNSISRGHLAEAMMGHDIPAVDVWGNHRQVTGSFLDGSETWEVQCNPMFNGQPSPICTPENVLGSTPVTESGACSSQ